MGEIKSESKFLGKLLLEIIKTPITLILILFGKREFKEIFKPFREIYEFIFEAKFTANIIIITTITTLIGWLLLPSEIFMKLLNYPQDILYYDRIFALFSSAFIHADIYHLLGNMLAIFIFGRVVERKFGLKKTMLI